MREEDESVMIYDGATRFQILRETVKIGTTATCM